MEAALGGLHNSGARADGARPIVVDSIILDGEAPSIATHKQILKGHIPNQCRSNFANMVIDLLWVDLLSSSFLEAC